MALEVAASPRPLEPMTPSLSAENIMSGVPPSPTLPAKRKADDETALVSARSAMHVDGKENGQIPEKRPRRDSTPAIAVASASSGSQPRNAAAGPSCANGSGTAGNGSPVGLVELQKRKLVFKQAPQAYEVPRRKKLAFEAFLLDVQDGKETLTAKVDLPEQYHSVIVLAGHEATSASEGHFVNHLKKALDLKDLGDVIPSEVWSSLVSRLFTLEQYGFQPADFPSTSTGPRKVPAALQIRSWEAKEPERHFSTEQVEVVQERKRQRGAARREVLAILEGLDDLEVLELLKGDKADKEEKEVKERVKKEKKPRVSSLQDSPAPSVDRKSREGTAASVTSTARRSASPVKRGKLSPEEEEAARVKQAEREAKKAAAEQKRLLKEEKDAVKQAEVDKKEALVAKQKQTMNSFFKPKTVAPKLTSTSEAGPSKPKKVQVSDFDRMFKPVTFRPNVEWAPVNRFRYKRRSITPEGVEGATDGWEASDFIGSHARKTRSRDTPSVNRLPNGLKVAPLYGSVGEVWAEHQDALDPRKVLNRLKNNKKFPWKTLAFDQQVRPPYSGTFTKRSVVVGPRTPFAQDPMFDYSYDSGDDWQDDEGGEDVDDNANLEPEEQVEEDDEDEGEFDDWLDDSEDADASFTPPPPGEDDDMPVFVGGTGNAGGEQSRLPMKVVKKRDAPVKRVVKVTPTWKGPLWETGFGQGTEGMEVYRIQLLNDTPHTFDPFTYVSPDPAVQYKATYSSIAVGANLSVRTLLSVDEVNAPPASAPAAADAASTSDAAAASDKEGVAATNAPSGAKARPSGPKIAFPASHLPELLQLIEGNKRIRTDLISQLKAHFDSVTSKAAIEQKLREVAVREGRSKDSAWKVLPEAWAAAGVNPPVLPAAEGMVLDA